MNVVSGCPRRTVSAEQGFAPTEFVLFSGLILLPTLMLVLLLPSWWERQMLARVAAQEAARTAVLAQTWEHALTAAAGTVEQTAANHGVPATDLALSFRGGLERGSTVTATVTVAVPALPVPFLGRPGFWLTAEHTEAVDRYRSIGVDG